MTNQANEPGPYWPAALVAMIFLILAATYSVVTPLFESPDELWHYPFVWHLARTGELPVQDPAAPQLWRQEGSQPPLYYAAAALLTAPIPADDLPSLLHPNPHADIGVVRPDGNANIIVHTAQEAWPWRGTVLAVHLARLLSVVLGVGTVLTVYALGRTLWPERPALALTAMAFVAFNPMFIFISGSVNNDNLIIFLASLTLWGLTSFVIRLENGAKPSGWWFAGLGLVVGLAALSKVSGLGLVGLTGLTLLWQGLRRRSGWIAIVGNSIVTLLAGAIAGWWYWRNFRLYGDWTGVETMVAMMGGRPLPPTIGQFLAETPGLLRSFWGLFGYFSVPMPSFLYWLLNGLLLAGLGGWLVIFLTPNGRAKTPPRLGRVWPILPGWMAILLAGFIRWTLRTPATQGRLLFPMLGALAIFWATGWLAFAPPPGPNNNLGPILKRFQKKRYRRVWSGLPGVMMLSIALWVPWGVIGPAYARPTPIAALPASAQQLDVVFGDRIHLLGYESAVAAIRPGDTLPLTLYWRSDVPIPEDYTVFIHLLDDINLIIAQRNVFHGPGVSPTGQWRPAELFADNYSLRLPGTAFAPAQAHFEVGLYDHTTGLRLPVSTGGDSVHFGAVEIRPPFQADFPNQQILLFEDDIALRGYNINQRQAAAGETITLTLYWQSQGRPTDNYKIFVHLVGENETRIAQDDSEPQNGAAPTSHWAAGQPVVDEHILTIPPDAPPGTYRFVVGLYDDQTGRRLRLLRDGAASVQANSVTLSGVRVTPETTN